TGAASSGSYRIGGLVGSNGGSIKNSYNAGSVSSASGSAGGLAGENHGSIEGSYNTGEMADGTSVVGGLAGRNVGGKISASYNTGTVNGTKTIGGLVGWNENGGRISDSYNSGAVNSSESFCGGLVGCDGDSAGVGDYIVNSYNTGAVNGSGVYVGGLIGYNSGSSITNSYNAGPVNGTHYVGGLVGHNYDNITNSYNAGAVNGISNIGGLVGYNTSSGSIANSYNTGRVSGEPYRPVGGLAGLSEKEGAITNSYWDIETSGIRIGVGNDASYNSFGRTTAAMMSLSNYPQGSSEWDFADTWGIIHGVSYPYLKSIYTETPQVVSGTLSSGTGGQAIRTFVNGMALDNATTGANGFYYMLLANGTIADHDAVLAYVDNGSVSGNAIYGVSGVNTSVAGLNITVGAVNVYGNSASPGLTDLLATAKGSLAGNAILYSGSNTEANVVGDLHVIGPSGIGGNITASGSQIYSGAVTLNSDSTMTGSSITFESTVDGTYNLTIIGNGGFTGNIGGATALAGLSVSGITGVGGNVTTTGTQRYGDAVMLNSDSVLKGSIVIFTSSVDGAFNLAIDGNADINGKIGDMTALAGLTVNGLTGVGGDISTTGTQIYHGAVTLNNNSIMAGSNVTFTDTVDGAYYLVVQSDSAFNGDVGGRTPLARLEITGTTDIGGDVNTTVGQRYGGPVRLHKTGTTVMNGMDGRVILKETLDGNGDLTVIAGDGVTIEGNVKTVGAQTYNGPLTVNVGANALSLSGSRLSANSTVTTNNGGRWLAYAPDDGAITGGFMSDYNFTQYGSAYGSAALGDGNGLIYAESLTFNQSLTGVVTKTYDGTTGVDNLTAVNYQIDGPAGFTVSVVSASAHGVYGDKNVNSSNTPLLVTANAAPILSVLDSNGKPVHGFGLSTITASGYIGQITARPLTATQTGTVKKTYDGNAAAIFDGTNITLAGIVDGDSVHVSGVGTYDGKNAGTRNVTVDSVTIDNDNYSLATMDVAGGTLTGQIDRRALTATQTGTVMKTYDGNTAAIFDGTNITLAGIVDGDSVSVVSGVGMYDGKNAGTHNVTVDSVVLDNGNYSLAAADVAGGTLTGQIDRSTLTGIQSGTVKKTYDGNTAAIFDGTNITLAGIVDGDSVSVVNGVGTYDSKNAGTRNVTVDSVTIDNDNYSLAVADVAGGTLTGQIDRRALTITASSQNKIYDGAMNAVVNYGSDQVSGDDLIIAGTAVFADKNVGVGKNVSVTGINISGQDAGNYYLVNTSVTGVTADIGKAVLTISANNLTKDVGTSNPPFSVTCTGFAAGDSIAALDGTLALTTPATTDSLVGRYVITPSGVSSANYEIIFVEGVLVVQIPVPMSDAIVAAYRTMENGIYPTPWVSRLVGYHDGISDPLIDIIENGINTEFSGNGGGIEESGESDG
ncbi:MAG TPA: YDG domain-containing protein, partial [Bacillota bacterium]|nr:YDG domain-containing protein [Bacillota bacterium]